MPLPPGFQDFEPFSDWALETQSERIRRKLASDFSEIQKLYALGMTDNRIAEALAHCDQFSLAAMPEDSRTLFLILMALAEIRPQAEQYGTVEILDSVHPSRLPRSPESEFV
jgi:hypothetical protein